MQNRKSKSDLPIKQRESETFKINVLWLRIPKMQFKINERS